MVKTRKSAVETIGDHSDDELEIVRRRSVRLLAPMNGGESGKNAIEEETSPKTEEADEDEVSSPDENWQETPRRSTRKLLEKSRKLFEKEEAKAERNVKIKKQKDESDGDGRRRSGRQRSVLFDTLNLSLIGEQLWSSDRERQYHVKGIHDEMESDVEPYESILTLTGRRKGSKRIRTTRSQQRHSDTSKAKTHQAEDQEQEDASEQETSGNSKENSDEDEDDDSDEDTPPKSYFLRQHKPAVQRYTIPIETSRSNPNLFNSPARRKHFHRHGTSMSHRRRFQAHHVASSTSSSNSDEEDERKFQRRKDKSMTRARSQLLPMNMTPNDMKRGILRDRQKVGSSLADTEPMSIDRSITFEHIGGLSRHVEALKEMLVFPLLYPEVFEKFRINPPRGVLFHGAPGTGKTLVARALANECAKSGQKVAFFMRKGADCLSKWVGESERQLRLLFDQAYMMRPSIIFFDEIDGLAPVRSTRQDQIHSSIVSTLLALMDGLDSRGEVIVIGATNRIDAIDPALRRPGRFDGEFLFPMPCQEARRQILSIHTSSWHPPLNPNLLTSLTNSTVGYCGADLKGLCTEAAMFALRRTFPQIYTTPNRLQLDINQISVESQDFHRALKKMLPTAQRSNFSSGRALNSMIRPLLQLSLDAIYSDVVSLLPAVRGLSSSLTTGSSVEDSFSVCDPLSEPFSFQPRMLVCGVEGMGQVRHLGAALVHLLESLPCHTMDVASLHRMGTRTSEEACVQVVHEAQRMAPSVIYIPDIQSVWASTQSTFHSIFESLVNAIPSSITVLLLATADCPYLSLPDGVQALFSHSSAVVEVDTPCESARRSFLESLFLDFPFRVPPKVVEAKQLPPLPVAASLPSRQMSKNEVTRLEERREETLRELRIFLRDCTNKLIADRKFKVFTKPVDPEEAPDYYEVVTTPMDLSIIMNKIDCREYRTVKHWLADIDLITSNCIEYNPDSQAQGKLLRHRAWGLKDFAHALITREMDSDFEELCQELENNYQELLRSNDTPATVSSTPQISTNPTTTNDTQMARKSLRVRGIKAETPPPLSNLKKARRNDSSYESTPVKPNQTLDEEDDKTDANEDDTIIIEDVTDVSISEEMQLSPAVDDKPESAISPTSVEQCECSDSHETRKVSFREERTPESDRETHGNEAEPIATDELHHQSPDGNCVLADKAVFSELLERVVAVTCRATVSELEGIYSRLSQLIYLRRLELDKSVLVSDMVECIRRLELERNG